MEFVGITLAWDGEGVTYGLTLTFRPSDSEQRYGYTRGATGPPDEAVQLIGDMLHDWAAYGLLGIETCASRYGWRRMNVGRESGLPVPDPGLPDPTEH